MKIVVLFGGESVEHEISIISAFQVIDVLKTKYEVYPVYLSKSNKFYYSDKVSNLDEFKNIGYKKRDVIKFINKDGYYLKGKKNKQFDLIFPIVHGKGVEDGTLVSYFRFLGFDIVGNDVNFYSNSQDKKSTKLLMKALDIDVIKGQCYYRGDSLKDLNLNFPLILKPNHLGSSIGIDVSINIDDLEKKLNSLLKLDDSILIEEYLDGAREFNIAVLNNNGRIETSNIEEVIKDGIYTFDEKYLNGNKKKGMNISKHSNFNVEEDIKSEIEMKARKIYKELNASGVIRIDFLYKDKLYVNEINAIPGSYAYYLWEDKYDFLELLDIVIKESKRYLFFLNKEKKIIDKNLIFSGLNNY